MAKRRPALERRGPFAATLVRHPGKAVWVFALLAVPARVRGRKGHGDTVTVEFSFDPDDD